ncbi:MAG: hypothetical protein ABIG10_03855 [bacterium]
MTYIILPIRHDLANYLIKHGLVKKWQKVKQFLANDLSHPSLNFKKIILQGTIFYSFRLDKKYRGICVLTNNRIEIIMFTKHYQ